MSRWPIPERTTKGWASAVKQCTLIKEWETMVRNNIIKYDSKSCGVSESTSMHKHSKATSDVFHHSPSPSVKSGYDMNLEYPISMDWLTSKSVGSISHLPPALELLVCLIHTPLVSLCACDCCALFTPCLFLCVSTITVSYSYPACSFVCVRLLCLIHTLLVPLCVYNCWKLNSGLHVQQVTDPLISLVNLNHWLWKQLLQRQPWILQRKKGGKWERRDIIRCLFSCLRYRDTTQLQLLESQWKNMNDHHFQDSRRKWRWKRKHYETTEIRKGRKGNIINRKTQKRMTELN